MGTNVTPESVGIPSSAIAGFIKRLDQLHVPMHSLLISRNKQLAFEAYYAPFEKETLHRMFSAGKSMTSIAIGQLAHEGRLSLDDPIADHFRELLPEHPHPYMMAMTIKDMLTMTTCHTSTTYKANPAANWVASFFTTPPSHRPGTAFNYDTSATHTLGALVQKLSGKTVLDYLRDVCLDQIGFSQEAYMIQDPFGLVMAGSGLVAKPMDLMVFAQLLMADGVYHGSPLLSADYLSQATSKQVDTRAQGTFPETRVGYGYQFWRNRSDGYSCFGMGGQLAICLPAYDLIVVTTADTQGMAGGNQFIYDSLYEMVLPYLSDSPLHVSSEGSTDLSKLLANLEVRPVAIDPDLPQATSHHHHPYTLATNPHGYSHFALEIDHTANEGCLKYKRKGQWHQLSFGVGHMVASLFPAYEQACISSGAWVAPNTFYIKSHIIDASLGAIHFYLTFTDQGLSIFMKKVMETDFLEFDGYLEGHMPL